MSKSLFQHNTLGCNAQVTKVELEVISDADMYLFFEKGTRGKVSFISETYSKANNKFLKSYDLKQESNHIIYLDANNGYENNIWSCYV